MRGAVKTSCERSNLAQSVLDLFVVRLRAESQPRVRVVGVAAEDGVDGGRAEPAEVQRGHVRHEHDVRPAVVVGDRAQRLREPQVRPGDTRSKSTVRQHIRSVSVFLAARSSFCVSVLRALLPDENAEK